MVNRFQDVCNSFIASVNSQPVNMPEFVFRLRARPLVNIAGEQFIRFKLFFHLARGLFRPLGIMILKVHNRERIAVGNHIINEFSVRETFVQGVNIITFDHGSAFLRNSCCGQDVPPVRRIDPYFSCNAEISVNFPWVSCPQRIPSPKT